MVKVLADLGVNFDCASEYEFKLALEAGADPTRIIYAHPAKPYAHLKAAKKMDVRLMTFDNVNELKKIKVCLFSECFIFLFVLLSSF